MPKSTYSIRPFSGDDFLRNADRCRDGETPCAICGKAVRHATYGGIVVNGGRYWGDESSDPTAAGWMGFFPVGPSCHRKYAVELPATEAEARALVSELLQQAAVRSSSLRSRRLREKAEKVIAAWKAKGGGVLK